MGVKKKLKGKMEQQVGKIAIKLIKKEVKKEGKQLLNAFKIK